MNTSRIAVIAASTSIVAWLAKTSAIAMAGGLDRSPLEGPLFVAGLLSSLAAVIAISLTLTHARSVLGRIGAVLAALAGVFVLVAGLNMAIARIQPTDPSWVWAEINLWITAAFVLGTALVARRSAAADDRSSAGRVMSQV